jgi:hypothetical protein
VVEDVGGFGYAEGFAGERSVSGGLDGEMGKGEGDKCGLMNRGKTVEVDREEGEITMGASSTGRMHIYLPHLREHIVLWFA